MASKAMESAFVSGMSLHNLALLWSGSSSPLHGAMSTYTWRRLVPEYIASKVYKDALVGLCLHYQAVDVGSRELDLHLRLIVEGGHCAYFCSTIYLSPCVATSNMCYASVTSLFRNSFHFNARPIHLMYSIVHSQAHSHRLMITGGVQLSG